MVIHLTIKGGKLRRVNTLLYDIGAFPGLLHKSGF